MSHFPQRFNGLGAAQLVASMRSFAAFSGRFDVGTGVRGSATAGPSTQTTASFVVPSLGGSVVVNVGSTANFIVGDYVMIGSRACYLTTPASPGAGAGTVLLSGRYQQCRPPGAAIAAGTYLIGPAGELTSMTISLGGGGLPDHINITSTTFTVANRSNIPANSYVKLTNYAGVYQVTNIAAGQLTLTYVIEGDLPVGTTCIQDISGGDTGAYVTQFYPIGVVPKNTIFSVIDAYLCAISVTTPSGSTPNISIGFVPNPYTSGPTTRMGEIANNAGQFAGTVAAANVAWPVQGMQADNSADRLMPMDGMAFGVRVNTPQSASHIHNLNINGLLVPMQ